MSGWKDSDNVIKECWKIASLHGCKIEKIVVRDDEGKSVRIMVDDKNREHYDIRNESKY